MKNFVIRPGLPLRMMEAGWQKRAMQFVDIPSGDLNMTRYVELLIHTGYPQRYCQVMGTKTAPLIVEAESAYRDLDATSANGIQYVRDNLCFPIAAGSFEDGNASFHMSPEEFRRWGHAVVDWVADYQRRVESLPVFSRVQPGQIRASLPAEPPQHGESFDAILADVERLILPGITHWQSPNFFALLPGQQLRAVHPGRAAFRRARRAGHALGHQPRLHGTGNARARLDGRDARPAGEVQIDRRRRRRDPGHRLQRRAVRLAGGARTGHRLAVQRARLRRAGWWPTPPPRPIPRSRRR